jgi:hypothetical protein
MFHEGWIRAKDAMIPGRYASETDDKVCNFEEGDWREWNKETETWEPFYPQPEFWVFRIPGRKK